VRLTLAALAAAALVAAFLLWRIRRDASAWSSPPYDLRGRHDARRGWADIEAA